MRFMETYTASDAKRLFGNVLNECIYGKKAVSVNKHGKVVAFIVPAEMWQDKKNPGHDKPLPFVDEIYKWREKYKNKKRKTIDSVKMIRELREERVDQILKAVKGGG